MADKPKTIDLLKVSLIVGEGLTMDTSPQFRAADEGERLDLLAGGIELMSKHQRFILHQNLLESVVDEDEATRQ